MCILHLGGATQILFGIMGKRWDNHPIISGFYNLAWDLGRGESEVLTLALEKPRTGVVLDDLQALKCAELFEIPLIGTPGLVVLAKWKGLVPLVKPVIERLVAVGLYINSAILTRSRPYLSLLLISEFQS